MRIKLAVILTLVFVISCVSAQTPRKTPRPTSHEAARIPALGVGGKNITAPNSVKAGQDFEVAVRTGGNGCVSQGDASVILSENSADIFVYDHTSATRPGMMCTMIYKQFDHKVTLRFSQKGEAVIRIWGRNSGGRSPMGAPVVIEKKVMVK